MPLSFTVRLATRLAMAVGLNATVTWQEDPAASVEPQVLLVMLKSPASRPVITMPLLLLKVSEPEPPPVKVKVWVAAAVVPTLCEDQTCAVGVMVRVVVAGGKPSPVSITVCGLLLALSTKESVAVRVPGAEGAKIICMKQVFPVVPGGMFALQAFLVM